MKPEDRKPQGYWAHGRKQTDEPIRVEIDGRTFESVPVENKRSCADCDILKLRPPKGYASLPLCYETGATHGHAIVQLCQGHQMIWKEI